MTLLQNYALFWITFIFCALTAIDGQYSNLGCDHNRLQHCQQELSTSIQEPSNPQSYSGISNGWQNSGQNDLQMRCSSIRQNLDCLLMYTPSCQGSSPSDSRNSGADFIRRGRQYLERFCEQSNGGWKSSSCFHRSDVRQCESQHNNQISTVVSSTSCKNFQNFRDCVIKIVRGSCLSQELQLMGTYLIDKGQELSWSCTLSTDYGSLDRSDGIYNPNDRIPSQNQFTSSGGGYNNQGGYGQQYGNGGQQYGSGGQQYGSGGQQYGSGGQQYGSGGQQYGPQDQRYGQQYGSTGQYGGNQYGSRYDGNQQSGGIDRQIGLFPTTDSCLEKAGYFVRSCEDTLIQRQRDAREGRSSHDVQRRICCALFFYRDCISRVVVDRCRDPSPTAVDILMGSRKRDLTVTCREYSRDQCSASPTIKGSIVVFFSIFISIWLMKSKA